ncbi:MAG: pseudouridine synthase [Anaerorhabdus sp.]
MERLQKVIAASGLTSRRKAEELIVEGRVKVNGIVVNTLGYCSPKGAFIEVDGKPITKEEKVYFVLHKPKKTICSVSDDRGRKTVVDYLAIDERVFPVGRLDYDTTGVLILTNDGEFANEIIHPSSHVEKTYEAVITGLLTRNDLEQLQKGIVLEDGKTLPAKVKVLSRNEEKKSMIIELTIQEGRNHQVKRMMEYFGCKVARLYRKSIGPVHVKDLLPGEYRLLKPYEIKQLRHLSSKK